MGIFNRNKPKQEPVTENRDNEPKDSYSIPVGLEFLTSFLSRGEATAISAFFGGLQLISSTIASIPIHVKDSNTGEIISHPLYSAFDNGLQSKFTIMKQIVWDMYVHGNGLFYIRRAPDGTPIELIYCSHGSYSIMYNELKRELYYLIPSISKKKVEPINVIHLVLNSKDGINGKGIPSYAKNLLDIALATDNHAKSYFEHGASISGILKSTRQMDTKQKLDAKASWESVHGAGKSGGIAVLGNDWTYEPVANNANDSEMLQTREFNAKSVCQYLNIDPLLLGIDSASSYNSIEQAQLSFLSHCIYPLIALIESEFNRKLIKPSEKGKIIIDLDESHIMFADKSATANYYSTLTKNGIMTINEVRHFLNLQPKEGCDDLIIPFTDINANKVNGGTNIDEKEDEQQDNS